MDAFVKEIHRFVEEKETSLSLILDGLKNLYERLTEPAPEQNADIPAMLRRIIEVLERTRESFSSQKVTNFFIEKLIQVQEEERRVIARELHDTLAQSLANIVIRLDFCLELMSKDFPRAVEEICELKRLLKIKIGELRKLMFHLHPLILDEAGFVTAVRKFVENFRKETKISVNLLIDVETVAMERKVSTSVFRVLQEAMINARKHSEATIIDVEISTGKDERRLTLVVSDNGRGFDVESVMGPNRPWDKFGLASMRERIELLGGRFQISSEPGKGTTIRASVPLESIYDSSHFERRTGFSCGNDLPLKDGYVREN